MTDRASYSAKVHKDQGAACASKLGVTAIKFPEPERLRSRKVVTRSRSRITGKYPSWKMGRMMQWESPLEHEAFILLDADPTVLQFHEQPCKIHYLIDGIKHEHTPDVLVRFGDYEELWEIKPIEQADRPEVRSRTNLLSVALPRWGYEYRMVTSDELSLEPEITNARQLVYLGRAPISLLAFEKIRSALTQRSSLCWGAIANGLVGPFGLRIIARLILEGKLWIDMTKEIRSDSLIIPCSTSKWVSRWAQQHSRPGK